MAQPQPQNNDQADAPAEADAPAAATAANDTPADLTAELSRTRFEAVAARAGLDEDYLEEVGAKAEKWLADQKLEPTKQNLGKFVDEYRTKKPKLFAVATAAAAPATARTVPPSPNNHPAAPAPAHVENPYSRWRALKEAGRHAEAEAFYRLNHRAIARHA
jgi:hypothetical protein